MSVSGTPTLVVGVIEMVVKTSIPSRLPGALSCTVTGNVV